MGAKLDCVRSHNLHNICIAVYQGANVDRVISPLQVQHLELPKPKGRGARKRQVSPPGVVPLRRLLNNPVRIPIKGVRPALLQRPHVLPDQVVPGEQAAGDHHQGEGSQ